MLYPNILIVEPITEIQHKISEAFEDLPVRVITVSSGREALNLVQRLQAPVLAIIELKLPDMDGFELAQTISHLMPMQIMMTGYHADSSLVVSLLETVAEDFIRKPINTREMAARAIRLLARVYPPLKLAGQASILKKPITDYSKGHFRLV